MQTKVRENWGTLYRFDLQEQFLPDYEVSNWYTSTHPRSRFVTNLMVARADVDCRHTLRNKSYAVHYVAGASERRTLESVAELRATLEGAFRITLPNTPDLDAALERIIRQSE